MLLLTRDPEKRVKQLVKKLTHSGEPELNKTDLLELKHICKCKSGEEQFIIHVYNECMSNLARDHSQVRLAALKLIEYLFNKTHVFRKKLLDDFDLFLELTVAISQTSNNNLKLPPPKKYSTKLQEYTAKAIYQWHADFGLGYDKLRYAYRYLREHKLIDLDQFRVRSHVDQLRRKQDLEKQERVLTRKVGQQINVFETIKSETEQLIIQIESIIEILVPDDQFVACSSSSAQISEELSLNTPASQLHGITTSSLARSIEIEFDRQVEIKKSNYNECVLKQLRELKNELTCSKIPELTLIVKTLSKKASEFVGILKEAIDLKCKAINTVLKISDLNILDDEKTKENDSESDSSEDFNDFIEVPEKQDLESYIPKNLRAEYGLMGLESNNEEQHNKQNVNLDVEIISVEANKLPCRVKLESGKLCPRRDKIKCPFHGKIIARDLEGLPINKELRQKELDKLNKKTTDGRPDWQDPKLLKDLEEAIGIDLTLPKYAPKKRNGSERKLDDIKTCDKTSKQRLEKRMKLLAKYDL